jgi:hypothetical protein
MKVLNLQCTFKHDFEGWFGSEEDFRTQLSSSMVECPMCGNTEITKMLSAPRLNLGAQVPTKELIAPESSANKSAATPSGQLAPAQTALPSNIDYANLDPKQLQSAWLKMVNHVIAHTEDVGTEFVSEARKMHYGETQERSIRGHATPSQTQELIEEGIAVLPLPIPAAIKGTIQ